MTWRNWNRTTKIITINIYQNIREKLDALVEDGWFFSLTEVCRHVLYKAIFENNVSARSVPLSRRKCATLSLSLPPKLASFREAYIAQHNFSHLMQYLLYDYLCQINPAFEEEHEYKTKTPLFPIVDHQPTFFEQDGVLYEWVDGKYMQRGSIMRGITHGEGR